MAAFIAFAVAIGLLLVGWGPFCCGSVCVLLMCLPPPLPPSPSVSPSFPPWVGPSAISKLRLSSRSFLRAVRLGHSLPPFPAHLVLGSHPSPSPSPPLLLLVPTIHRSRGEGEEAEQRSGETHKKKWEVQEAERIDSHIVCSHWPHTPFSPAIFLFALHLAALPPRTPPLALTNRLGLSSDFVGSELLLGFLSGLGVGGMCKGD